MWTRKAYQHARIWWMVSVRPSKCFFYLRHSFYKKDELSFLTFDMTSMNASFASQEYLMRLMACITWSRKKNCGHKIQNSPRDESWAFSSFLLSVMNVVTKFGKKWSRGRKMVHFYFKEKFVDTCWSFIKSGHKYLSITTLYKMHTWSIISVIILSVNNK